MPSDNISSSVNELIRKRYSPRAFDPRPLDTATVTTLFEAARWAPSCYNEQPWRFLVALRQDQAAWEKALSCLVPFNRQWARNASLLFFTLTKKTFTHNDKPNAHGAHDVGLAVAQLTLQATDLGLHVHQMAGIDGDAIRDIYSVPGGMEPVTGVVVGHLGDPAELDEALREKEEAARRRRPLAELVFQETFGQSASFAV